MNKSNGKEDLPEERKNHEAVEVLRDTLEEVFYDPTEEEVDRIEESVDSLSSELGQIRREQREELGRVQRSIEKKFSDVGETYQNMEEALRKLQEASTQMRSLLENEDGDSRISELAQKNEKDTENLEASLQSLEEVSLEFHRSHVESFEDHSEALRDHDEHLGDHHATAEEYSEILFSLKELVQEIEAGLNDKIEATVEDLREGLEDNKTQLQTVDEKARESMENLQSLESDLGSQVQEVTKVVWRLQKRQSHILIAVGLTTVCVFLILVIRVF